MTIKEMRELPDDELRSEIDKASEKVFKMRFQGKGKDLENPGLLKMLKKEIARMKTVMNERELRKRSRLQAGATEAGAAASAEATSAGES